jgi:hypothetical protein
LPNLDAWLRSILWDSTLPTLGSGARRNGDYQGYIEVHRLKGRLPLSNGEVKIVQGVREVFEILDSPESSSSNTEVLSQLTGKIVLIGRRLIDVPFEESFLNAMGS